MSRPVLIAAYILLSLASLWALIIGLAMVAWGAWREPGGVATLVFFGLIVVGWAIIALDVGLRRLSRDRDASAMARSLQGGK